MEGDNWQRVKQIFADALERPPDERVAFVSEACQDDTLGLEVDECFQPALDCAIPSSTGPPQRRPAYQQPPKTRIMERPLWNL